MHDSSLTCLRLPIFIPRATCIVRLLVAGVTLGLEDKLIIATKLAALGVDVCEAGVP